jgi:rare lipoprotein A
VSARWCSALPALPLVLLLAACGTSHTGGGYYRAAGGQYPPGHARYKIGTPYQIGGVWYYPKVDYDYDRTGVASWYGEAFNEKYTANGEVFDLNRLTAAHPTLPLPSVVDVTNLDNGRELKLRVNDRGPYANGRIIDVSRRAAQLLGFESRGTANVRVRIMKEESIKVAEAAMRGEGAIAVAEAAPNLPYPPAPPPVLATPPVIIAAATPPPPPPRATRPPPALAAAPAPAPMPPPRSAPPPAAPPPAPSPPIAAPAPVVVAEMPPSPPKMHPVVPASANGGIFIQAGAFSVRDNAERVQSRIARLGSVRVTTASVNGIEVYRVRLGPVTSEAEAEGLIARLAGSGYPGARIVAD